MTFVAEYIKETDLHPEKRHGLKIKADSFESAEKIAPHGVAIVGVMRGD